MRAKEKPLKKVLCTLNKKGYTLHFGQAERAATAWGVHTPYPSELEYEVKEIIDCYSDDEGEETFMTVFAVQTIRFGLKGIIIKSLRHEKYWTLAEICNKFQALWLSMKIYFKGFS